MLGFGPMVIIQYNPFWLIWPEAAILSDVWTLIFSDNHHVIVIEQHLNGQLQLQLLIIIKGKLQLQLHKIM